MYKIIHIQKDSVQKKKNPLRQQLHKNLDMKAIP